MMMEKILMQPKQVRFGKVVKFILPTYLTSLFNTLYTIVDGIFVSACVGTNALAAINIVYPIVNILTGIALAFATGGGAFAAISLGAGQKEKAGRQFSVCLVMTLLVSGLAAGGRNCQYFAGSCVGGQVEHGSVGSWSGHYFGIGSFLRLGDLVFLSPAAAAAAHMAGDGNQGRSTLRRQRSIGMRQSVGHCHHNRGV